MTVLESGNGPVVTATRAPLAKQTHAVDHDDASQPAGHDAPPEIDAAHEPDAPHAADATRELDTADEADAAHEPDATRAAVDDDGGGDGPVAPHPVRIMIVEDSPGDARLATEILARGDQAFVAATFERVDDAIAALVNSDPECVLLDLGSPGADGLDRLSRILSVAPGLPIVVLSELDDDRLALAAVGRGAQDFVGKRDLAPATLWRAIDRSIERGRVTRDLALRASHDSLTGLPNRALFVELVEQAIARSQRWDTGFAILFMGIEDFKSINDNFGHAAGDEVLREIARRLEGGLSAGDTPCRYAGGEFAALCATAGRPDEAGRVAARIHESICRHPIAVGFRSLNVSVSVCVALGSGDDDAVGLLHRVDGALYEAKLTGAVCIVD